MSKAVEKAAAIPTIRESTRQIWLAGLGALSLAEDESGKLFKALVKRGKTYESDAKDRFDDLKSKLDVRKSANEAIEKINDSFDEGVSDVLNYIGLPTKKEIDSLSKRVEKLTAAIEKKPARTARRVPRREKLAEPAAV